MKNPSLLKITANDKISVLTWNVRKGSIKQPMYKKVLSLVAP